MGGAGSPFVLGARVVASTFERESACMMRSKNGMSSSDVVVVLKIVLFACGSEVKPNA